MKRVIARLDTKGRRLIKGIQFEGVRVLGDALDFAKQYYSQGIDEIIYIDSVASLYGRPSMSNLLEDTVEQIFIPVTAGGGVTTTEDVAMLLSRGADKVAINTAAIKNPNLISKVSRCFGAQCMVSSIQAKFVSEGHWEAYVECGREKTGIDVLDWAKTCVDLGAGEILLSSIDKDGTCKGPDLKLINLITNSVNIPVVASSGICSELDVKNLISEANVDSIAIGKAFHNSTLNIGEIKSLVGQ